MGQRGPQPWKIAHPDEPESPPLEVVQREFARCHPNRGLDGFIYFCEHYVQLLDKRSKRAIPFVLYRCQRHLAGLLIRGLWIINLKARQLGITWLIAAYVVWRITFTRHYTVISTSQDRDYAEEFVDRIKFIHERLPGWMQQKITAKGKKHLEFNHNGHGCWIKSLASTKKTARSYTADFCYFDEGAYQDYLKAAVGAADPAMERGGGQMAITSSSSGPNHYFAELWHDEFNQFEKVFYSWQEVPDRDMAWYEQKARTHRSDPLWIKREYPNNAQEAFEAHEGRIYPTFAAGPRVGAHYREARNVQKLPLRDEGGNWLWPQRFRGIDWGMTDPFVCLWIAYDPTRPTALTIDPSCTEVIREMLAYSFRENTEYPEDKNNHCPDALRYVVVQYQLTCGHVHVYRAVYLPNSRVKLYDTPKLYRLVEDNSYGEEYVGTVADRSGSSDIATFATLGMEICPTTKLGIKTALSMSDGSTTKEVLAGIRWMNNLIVGTLLPDQVKKFSRVQKWVKRLKDGYRRKENDGLLSMEDRIYLDQAKLALGKHLEGQSRPAYNNTRFGALVQ